jgi:hypothetical protein
MSVKWSSWPVTKHPTFPRLLLLLLPHQQCLCQARPHHHHQQQQVGLLLRQSKTPLGPALLRELHHYQQPQQE